MADLRTLLICLLCALGLSACGDYPTPFKGNPGATASRLAQPTAPLLAVVTPDASILPAAAGRALAENLATALQTQEVPAQAKRPQSSDWQLVSRMEQRGDSVVPVFTVKDPRGGDQGSAEGSAAPAAAWSDASPEAMHQLAEEAAPKVAALLTSIRITRDRADPNSLMNRPTKVMVAEVTGAPGDGNQVLTREVRKHLAAFGPLVQTTQVGADFLVRGDVVVVPTPNRTERVEIQWVVSTPGGDERGKVVQLNEIPAGTLGRYWGDIAVVVGTEAAGGINDVLIRQTGKDEGVKPAAAADAEPRPVPPQSPASPPAKPGKPKPSGGNPG